LHDKEIQEDGGNKKAKKIKPKETAYSRRLKRRKHREGRKKKVEEKMKAIRGKN